MGDIYTCAQDKGVASVWAPPNNTITYSIIEKEPGRPTKVWNYTLSFHLPHKSNDRTRETTAHPVLIQKVNCQQRIPSQIPLSV
jgi:hypothetical protein